MFPHSADVISLNKYPLQIVAMCVTIFLLVLTMRSYYQSYRYSRFPLQIAIVYSGGWLIISQLIIVMGTTWRLSWWIYHFLMLFSMLVMIAGLMKQYAARGSITSAVRSLFSSDPIERITSNISPSVKALIMATESRDTYTAGHNFRVTIFALHLAEEMGVNPEQLRALAQGAIVHDVGKINVPDSVLNKAGKLTEDERSIIEMHPIIGYNMCKSLGFMKDELSIIRSHHERWNGTGYPDRLQGEEIPILARITAVADVYDALTSTRSYRQAWTHEAAMKLLQGDKGSHFDPACVDAWERVCERDPRVYRVTVDEMETGVGLPSLKQASHSKVG
jgi:putative nucleotidyltransferase with HDIG domain